MDELIYSVRRVFKEYLPTQQCKFFNIPEYQRGFKWSRDNVIQLLEDLKHFRGGKDAFYCLQNITIVKSNLHGVDCMNVIDGQQRLTTLFILVSFLQRESSEKVLESTSSVLKYSVRGSTDEFLQNSVLNGSIWENKIDSSQAQSKDQYYILEVADAIKWWFENNTLDPKVVLDDLVLIVNQVKSGDEETVFASLNGGKVDLDGADLVRAILITRAAKQKYSTILSASEAAKISEFRIKIGIELDTINAWWSQKDVQIYFEQLLPNRITKNKSFKYSQYPIDLLYYAFFEAYKEKFTSDKNDRDLELRFFENGMDFNGDNADDHLEFYQTLIEFHSTMVDWYNNDEIFNYLGYLLYNFKSGSMTFSKIWKTWLKVNSKKEFVDEIKQLIRESLANAFVPDSDSSVSIEDKLAELRKSICDKSFDWFHSPFTIVLLPLFDVLPVEESIKNRTLTTLTRVNTEYLKRVSGEDKEHVRSQKRQLDENATEEERAELLEENRRGLNSLGNLVLLHEKINCSYGNDKHPLKMDRIFNEYFLQKNYIRPHTFKVFSKKLTNLDNNGLVQGEIFWSDDDIQKTIDDLDYRLVKFLGFPNNIS